MTTDTVIRMPKLADTLVEGTLGRWLKQVGERVGQGEPLASIETDKVTTDITSPAAGTLLEILVAEGQTVAVETPIARVGEGGTPVESPPRPTPVAARLLAEHGVSADEIRARSGRLKKDDVLEYVQSRQIAAAPLSSMRRAIAEHMTKAYQTIPHGQTVMDADVSRLVSWRDDHKSEFQRQEGAPLTFTVLFVYALAHQLATLGQTSVDVGVAVALDSGLVVPVLRRANELSLGEVARGVADLANRARTNELQPNDLQGARMTLTNVGSFGNLSASPIVPLGQLGILGPGVVERRPLPGPDHGVRLGWRCLFSFVFDRRWFDDFSADRFLRGSIDELLGVSPG